ncbi:uncharacterized protein [Miscanthus floridulus]|uniref:uncharacterized protein isoform X5 n=1 Tax=Miscanthus floridulus TaxID=154761 RepID=UPI00345AC4D3
MDLAGMKRRELQALCKRHGLPAGGSNADLVARLEAALSGTASAEEEVAGVPARKGCLKQTDGDAAEAKKVTFAAEEGKARRLRSRVIWSPIAPKTRGKSAQARTDSAVAAAEDSISAEVAADVPVRRSRRNSVCAAEAEEAGEAVAVDRKRKRKNQENDESVAISAQVGVLSRVTRRSSLVGVGVVLPPVVEKKRGRGKAAGGSNKLVAKVQDSEPDVQNSAQVDVSARITRSRATAPVVISPTVVENKRRRKTGDARTNLELPTVSDVPRNDTPVTRSLRSRVVQVNNSMVDETHTARQLENKTQPSRPPTRRHQQVSSSVEDKNQEQTAAPNKAPILRRSGRNHSEDAEKQPEVKDPVKRSTRKSVVPATLEKEENDLIEEKNPEAHVRRSMMKSIVPVKDIKGIGEKIQNANSEDAVKQAATKGPVRGSRRKSVVSELHKKEKGLVAEKNTEAHEGRSMRKPVVPVKDIKAVVEEIKNAKGKDVEKQFVVKQSTMRSSRKSVLPDILENNSGLLAAEMNAEMNVRRSTRKSVLPNMLNEENQDQNKIARNEHFQSGKCQDDERQQKVKEPIRRSRRSVVAVPFEEQNNGLYEEKISKIPMRRSTGKSVALNEVEKVSMDDTEIVAREPERVGEEGLKLRKHKRSSLEISSSANDSRKMEDFDGQKFRKQQNAQIPNEKGNTGGTLQASNSTTLKGRSSKRIRTTASEEVRSVKEASDDIIIREATKDAHKATHENKESGSRVQEFGQVNATREEHSSGPLLVTVTPTEEISTAQSVRVVIPGSESGDNANESSDKSKQEHSDIQAVDSHLSETSGELDQSSCIAGLVLHNFDVSEDKSLMSKGEVNMGANDMLDGLSIDFTVGDREVQSPVSGEGRVGLEANASEPGQQNLANVMSTGLHAKSLQHDTDIIAEKTDKDVLPMAFPIEEHGEKYAVSPVAFEKSVDSEASACESAGKPLTGIFCNDLHTKHLQHDSDVLTKETGEASGAALPISESDTNPEIQCNAEESIRAADLGKCPSRVSKGSPYSTSLPLESADDDCILPVLNGDKGCSSDGRPSSFGLEFLFAEACEQSYSKNIENTVGDCEERSPISGEGRVGLEANASESGEKNIADIMSTGLYAKSLQHDTDIIGEETDKDVLPMAFPIEEHGEKYAVSPVAVEKSVGSEASACESAGKPLTGIFCNDLHTKHLQHDSDVLTKETGEASGAAPPISESDTNPENQCNAEESIRAADLGKCLSRVSNGNPYSTSLQLEGAADDCILPVLNADKGCSSDGRPSSFGLELLFVEACKESYSKNIENTVGDCEERSPISGEGRVGLEANASKSGEKNIADIMSTGLYAKSLQHDTDIIAEETGKVAEESIRAADLGKCPSRCSIGNPLSTSLHLEGAADDTSLPVVNADKGCSSDGRPSSFDLELMFAEECKESYSRNAENSAVEIDGGNKPSTPVIPGFYVQSDCLEDEDVQPTECDADKKLDDDEGVVEAEAQEKSNDQHVPAKTDLNMKLNDELAGPGTESSCSITEKNAGLVADNLDEQAIILVQHGDVQEGDLKKPSPCSTTPECKHKCGLPEETVLPPKNTGSLSSAEQSPFGLESLFSQENIDESMRFATAHTKNGLDDSKDCHVKSALENTLVSEPFSHHEEIDGGNKPSTPVTPGFYVRSDCLEDDVQPTECDADKKLDVDEGVAEEVLAQEKSNDQHIPAKTDLNMKLNDELASPGTESGCSITEKNGRLVADILNQQAIIQVQQGDWQEGDLEKPSLCSAKPECKHECDLPEETVLPSRNTGPLPSAGQSPFGLESLFSQESIDKSVGYGALASATAHTENGFDDSKGCHVKSALENTHVSEPFSHDDISKNDDCMGTSQQDIGMEGLPEANLDEERVLSVFSLDAKHIKEVINFEEVACEGEGSKKFVHSEELKASYEKTNVNGPDGNAHGITDAVLSSALHTPDSDNYEICLGSNTDVLHQGHNDQCSDDTEDIIEDASAKYIERGIVLLSGKGRSNLKDGELNTKLEGAKVVESGLYFNKDIGNILDSGSVAGEIAPSGSGLSKDSSEYRQEVLDGFSMQTSLDGSSMCGEKIGCRVDAIENEGALSEEATCTMKNYAGTCSSNPRELLMELQSLFSKGNTKESDPHDCLAFPSAENSGDESINVEQRVKVHHSSDLSHLDELIGCSNTEMLRQGHNHKDRSNVDRVEQVASEPCTNDIVEAAATAKCIESGQVLPPSEERSNLNDGQLNPKLESPNIIVSGLNCDKDVCNTSDNGSIVAIVGERTPSGSGLPEDYPKDHYPRQELLDGFSVESSLQGTIFGKTIVSGVAGIGNPSSSLATPDYKYEGALSEEAVCRMKNYTGTSSVDPRHLVMDLQSLFSEGSTEKSDLQDNLAFPGAESGRDERIICHVERLVDTHVSSEPDTYQGPCRDLSRHEEKESCVSVPMQVKESGGFLRSSHMKGSLTSVQIDLADDAHLIERDIVAAVEVLCEEKVERKSMPTSDSDILQEKSYSNGHGICQSRSQKHLIEANSRLFSCGTEVVHQDHKECNEPNEGKFSPKALVENMTEDAPIEGIGSSMMVPLISGMSEIPDEQLSTKMSDEIEELSFSCDKDTIENFCTGPAKRDLYPLPKDFHIDSCQKQEVPEVLSSPKSAEESMKFQCVSLSGSGPCQQHVNESTSTQVTCNIEPLHQDHEEYNQNNEDQTPPGIPSSSVPEAVEIEQSEMEIGLIPTAEASVLPVPDEQLNNKLDGNEDNHPNDLPAPRSEQSAYFQNNDLGSIGIDELRAKQQSFKVSSTVKGSYIATSAARPKPRDSMSQSAIALLRNIENTPAVKAGHPVKPNADGKDSSRRALQPISGRPREH